ncbi:MAG TPA: MATE family efflux transporter [Nevskiaceae bacterium]|nr:MATE family efflux transporter [Nevskiaceae bacterium]
MQDLTHGSVRGHIWRMTAFMLVSMLLQTLYSLVDLYWVSRLGKEAIAAVSIAGNLMMIVMAFGQMLGVGAAAVISHAAGRKDHVQVQRLFNQASALAALFGVVFGVGGLALKNLYVQTLAADVATAELASRFLTWFILAMAVQFPMMGLGSALRGIGNMRPGVVTQVGTIVVNMALAPILMFGWIFGLKLGIEGAAIATFIAILLGMIGLALYLRREATYLRVNLADWKPHLPTWRRILGIGLPSGVEFGLMTIYFTFIYAVIRPFGADAQAGFGIGMRIMQTGFMPAMAVGFACAAVAGQNYGASQPARVRETFVSGAAIATLFMLVFVVLSHVAPGAMIRVFAQEAPVVDVAESYLRIIAWNYIAFGLIAVSGGIFQGLGNTWPSLISSATRIVLIVAPAWWLASRPDFRLTQVWWLAVAAVVVQMTLCLMLLRREFTRKLEMPAPVTAAAETAA